MGWCGASDGNSFEEDNADHSQRNLLTLVSLFNSDMYYAFT